MSKILWFLIVSTFFVFPVYSANVHLDVSFEDNAAKYEYTFTFTEDEIGENSFSFEKPKDARLISAVDEDGTFLKPKVVGDYFLIDISNLEGKIFTIVFDSKENFKDLSLKNSFSTYLNLNLHVDSFILIFNLPDERETTEIIPRNYAFLEDNTIEWEFTEVSKDMFFLIDFSPLETPVVEKSLLEQYSTIILSFFFLIFVGAIFLLRFIFQKFKKKGLFETVSKVDSEKENLKNKENSEEDSNDPEISYKVVVDSEVEGTTTSESEDKEEEKADSPEDISVKQEEFMKKYLTENEQEIVKLIIEKPGIIQNDILNFLPSLSKSNLSKIITKLHGKKILSRIRVGKINKIHLGENLIDFSLKEKE